VAARLIELTPSGTGRQIPLAAPVLVLGRDPAADLVLEGPRISRRHALVRATGKGHQLEDLGSANGTRLNGRPVLRPERLAPGDRIEVAGEAILVYEADDARRLPPGPLLALVLALLLGLAGGGVWWWWHHDPLMDRAAAIAAEGLRAARAGDPATAKARLRSAAGLLYTNGRLDDVPRERVLVVAMERLGARLGGNVDLVSVFRDAIAGSQVRTAPGASSRLGNCRLDQIPPAALQACIDARVRQILIGLRQDPAGLPPDFARRVGERMRMEHGFLERALARGPSLVPMMERRLEQAHMPPLLHYLALIESGYRSDATSTDGAAGLWQLMPGTARQYGLEVDGARDQRRDPEAATRAAANYLRDLAFEFGGDALLLALAGYNRGENAVRGALKRMQDPFSDRSYWRLVENNLLPRETADYVPRFMAAAVAGEAGLPSEEELKQAGF
jgi:hypothetical protein